MTALRERAEAFLETETHNLKSWQHLFNELGMPVSTYELFKADLVDTLRALVEECAQVAEKQIGASRRDIAQAIREKGGAD